MSFAVAQAVLHFSTRYVTFAIGLSSHDVDSIWLLIALTEAEKFPLSVPCSCIKSSSVENPG